MSRILAFLLATAALLAGGCATSGAGGKREVTRAPAFRLPANSAPVSPSAVVNEMGRTLPGVPVYFSDDAFVAVNHEWLEDFVAWSWHAQHELGFVYVKNARDCDKFGMATFVVVSHLAAAAGLEQTPLFARLVVNQGKAFAGVGAGGRHALNGVYTDRAPHYWVLEPQPNNAGQPRLVPLAQYPNREGIRAVMLGEFNPLW